MANLWFNQAKMTNISQTLKLSLSIYQKSGKNSIFWQYDDFRFPYLHNINENAFKVYALYKFNIARQVKYKKSFSGHFSRKIFKSGWGNITEKILYYNVPKACLYFIISV
jgi:hypothetical protein